jgi:hypothetical protein
MERLNRFDKKNGRTARDRRILGHLECNAPDDLALAR